MGTEFFDRFHDPLTNLANKHGIDKESLWAHRLRDRKTENEFVQRLLNPPLDLPSGKLDYRPFNSIDPNYEKKIRNQIDTVKHRLQIWHRDKIRSRDDGPDDP